MQTIEAEVVAGSIVMTCPLAAFSHEDHAEFDDLMAALIDEHRPAGTTERHLIEELAIMIWCTPRVLLAEGAKIHEGLKGAASRSKSVTSSPAPFQRGIASENSDVCDLLDLTPRILRKTRDARRWPRIRSPATSSSSVGGGAIW